MTTEDTQTPNPEQSAEEVSAPEAELPETTTPEADPQPEADTDPFAAGVEEARTQEAKEDAPVEPQSEGDLPSDEPKPEGPQKGEPAKQDPPKPEDAPKSVDDEIKDLGITNERTQKRFRELSERANEAETLRARADKVTDWEKTIESTGATPQQFGAMLVYLKNINSGNAEAMNHAYDMMQKELQTIGQRLGREAPGFDPLSAHADLAEKVKAGDMDRATAVELIQLRQRGVLQQESEAAQQRSWQAQQAQQQAMNEVAALGNQLRAADPQFKEKFAFLAPTVEIIQNTLPPQQWAQALHSAYQRLPAIPAPAPAARPNNPARASAAPARAAVPKNPEDAFAFGVAEAQARGL